MVRRPKRALGRCNAFVKGEARQHGLAAELGIRPARERLTRLGAPVHYLGRRSPGRPAAGLRERHVPRIVKDCFGTVISTLNKMKECVRCELLSECRSINWTAPDHDQPPIVIRRAAAQDQGGEALQGDGAGQGR